MAAATVEQKKAPKLMSGVGLYQPPAMRAAKAARSPAESQTNNSSNSERQASRSKRPDMPMYVPRGRRQMSSPPSEETQTAKAPRSKSPGVVTPRKKAAAKGKSSISKSLGGNKSCDSDASSCDLTDEQACVAAKEEKKVEKTVPVEHVPPPVVVEDMKLLASVVTCKAVEEARCSVVEAVSKKEPVVFVSGNSDDESWESKFDESGDCLDPKALIELTQTVGKVEISKPASTYSNFVEPAMELRDSELGHVLEIYDFPAEFKDSDLVAVLKPAVGTSDFDLKWVNDTHAMVVFGSTRTAEKVLAMNHLLLKVRPLSQGIAETRMKAKRCTQFLRPYKPRPETCAAMAKRMVHSALGVRSPVTKEERDKEKAVLKIAREKRRLAHKQSEDAWEGNFGK